MDFVRGKRIYDAQLMFDRNSTREQNIMILLYGSKYIVVGAASSNRTFLKNRFKNDTKSVQIVIPRVNNRIIILFDRNRLRGRLLA